MTREAEKQGNWIGLRLSKLVGEKVGERRKAIYTCLVG
jgi:hypothetical protein